MDNVPIPPDTFLLHVSWMSLRIKASGKFAIATAAVFLTLFVAVLLVRYLGWI